MDTSALKKFAQEARRQLIAQVTARMDQVLSMDSAEIREKEKAVNKLDEQIHTASKGSVIDRVAYIWFNRFCALRFMDVNRYMNIGTVSPVEGYSQPEILQEAKQGHVDEDLDRFVDKQKVYDLLSGKIPSSDPQQEAYRLLLVGICNSYHDLMPFMFEKIADYTELLMPEDLLSQNSILQAVRDALTEDSCKDVEIIGWLYQFYISEKKDEVINRRSMVAKEEIPAATQLFTPHWIVQYLVENSLGRLWMLNRPNSNLIDKMEYFVKPEKDEPDFIRINAPEELKICDPACGSGHILVYAFELLYSIYEEEGYDASDIPRLILEKNLYGIEIDERAGELAAFSLFIKAREKYRRFFRKSIQPKICVLENIEFTDDELEQYMEKIGRNLFTAPLLKTLNQFKEADNFGSLLRPELTDIDHIKRVIEEKDMSGQLFFYKTHEKVLKALEQTDYLRSKYHVVVANPPYMGGKGQNPRLKSFMKDKYPDVKSDLFAAFVIRNLELTLQNGNIGMVTPFVWMFISSYEELRNILLTNTTITNLVQLEYNAFEPACIPVCAYTIHNRSFESFKGNFIKLSDFKGHQNQSPKTLEAIKNPDCGWFFKATASDFKKISGSPIAYWVSDQFRNLFLTHENVGNYLTTRQGLATGENDRFTRIWQEVNVNKIAELGNKHDTSKKWYFFIKGGDYKKWYGNIEYVVNWQKDGYEIRNHKDSNNKLKSRPQSVEYYFKENIICAAITSSKNAFRCTPREAIFDVNIRASFSEDKKILNPLLAVLNSKIMDAFCKVLSPTLALNIKELEITPIPEDIFSNIITDNCIHCIQITKQDWDCYETSWDFKQLPLLSIKGLDANTEKWQPIERQVSLIYNEIRQKWHDNVLEMQRLEEENNRIFIDAYELKSELTQDVPIEEITLTCNPYYRYNGDKTEKEVEALFIADTMKELISYAVGCMFGRYSLDKPGLILANQGETIEDYKKKIPTTTFTPDEDNVIPILDGDWFIDDITDRFKSFLRITFGEEHYEENLKFLEQAIGKDIRKYFLKDFYNHHIKMFKKRPIYWMFSSPKGSFNAVIYMHRYKPDTVSVVLNNYLREFRTKIAAKKENLEEISSSSSSSQRDKSTALKEIEKLKKVINELEDYERDVLYPLATQQIEIDLDDGVKVNYNKFGKALRKVPGLTGE